MCKNSHRAAAILLCAARLLFLPVGALSAHSSMVLDGATGKVLFQQAAQDKHLIASTTKIMTGLLICENCDPDQVVTIPEQAAGIEGSSLYLAPGEQLTAEALLYGMMLQSGNDAAAALALHLDGSIPAFAERMNRRARQLGLADTHFENPHGLDAEGNYSTAEDLAKLTAFALKNPLFAKAVSTKTAVFGNRTFVNHNKLLWRYPGAIGVKTGYTKAAGRLLVSAAEKNGRRLICVTINDPDDWADHTTLYNNCFAAMKQTVILRSADRFYVPVAGGGAAAAVLPEDYSIGLLPGEVPVLRLRLPQILGAPAPEHGRAGTLTVSVGTAELARLPLCWQSDLPNEAPSP